MITTQSELDYMNAALKRVSADTRLLEKKTTLALPASVGYATLPTELVRLEAAYTAGSVPLQIIPTVEYMRLATGATSTTSSAATSLVGCLVGRRLYVWPAPTATATLTVIYSYRTATIDSGSTFEIRRAARLVERLSAAYALMDDGQPELAQAELQGYQSDAARIRHRNRRAEGRGGSIRLAGRRRPPR